MWEAIASFLMDSMKGAKDSIMDKATEQGDSGADNFATGRNNTGAGSLWKDLAAGNYASAAGNAVQMGQNNAKQAGAQALQPPTPSQPSTVSQPGSSAPGPVGVQQSPFLQQMLGRYMRG